LDVNLSSFGLNLITAPISNSTNQFWRFTPESAFIDSYRLRNRHFNDNYSIDIFNDNIDITPHMALTGSYTGQYWNLYPLGDGTFKLNNHFTTPTMYLDVYSANYIPIMGNNSTDCRGQIWAFTKIEKV
jgi:hypothetical protein